MSVKITTIYTCDKCGEEFRYEPQMYNDNHLCSSKCLHEYEYDDQCEVLWNKCHRITRFEGDYYIDDCWKILDSFEIHPKECKKENTRKDCLVLAIRSHKGYENGEFSIRRLNTYTTDFERPRPRNTEIYCNNESADRFIYSLVKEPKRGIGFFEEFLLDAINGSDCTSDR